MQIMSNRLARALPHRVVEPDGTLRFASHDMAAALAVANTIATCEGVRVRVDSVLPGGAGRSQWVE